MTLGLFDVIDQMTGYQTAATLTAAARLGVFDMLAGRALTWPEAAAELATDPNATRALLDALVGVELLDLDDGGHYRAAPIAVRLGADGDLRPVVEKEAFLARIWLDLADSIRSGRPQLEPWRHRLVSDPDQARHFLEALVVLARETGPDLPAMLGIGPGATVADLGGGLGSYAVPLATAGARVTLVDLPPVAAWASEVVAAAEPDVRDRISVRGLDLLADGAAAGVGEGYDVVLLSHLLHDLADDDARSVLAVACSVARPGSAVVVFELPGDPPGAFGPLFDLMMHVETPGAARRVAELITLMAEAGLVDVAEVPGSTRPHGVLRGQVPADPPEP